MNYYLYQCCPLSHSPYITLVVALWIKNAFSLQYNLLSRMASIIICWPILAILTVLSQPFSFKNIDDAQQAIQEHSVKTNSSFSVYKTEKDFNLKGNIYDFY